MSENDQESKNPLETPQTRQQFLKIMGAVGLGTACGPFLLSSCAPHAQEPQVIGEKQPPTTEERGGLKEGIVAVTGKDYRAVVQKGLESMGGLGLIVKVGDIVVVKPNIGWDKTPEQGVNTHPDVVAELVKQAYICGAGEVRVFDRTCGDQAMSYKLSGIPQAAEAEGAKVIKITKDRFDTYTIPDGVVVSDFRYSLDVRDANVIINVPCLKHHCLAKLSLSLKCLMGLVGDNRSTWHPHIGDRLVDLWTVVRPQLTVLDATRILLSHGPWGGDLSYVKWTDTVAFSTDPIAIDTYGARLFGMDPMEVVGIAEGYQRGLGEMDLTKVNIEQLTIEG